jgi:3-hydroxyisobutyrate dehydrogenase-like beta-hydroxyacid dehydrogenase
MRYDAAPFDIALVGVGLLGSAIAERFLGGRLRVIGFDLRSAQRQWLESIGCCAANSVSEAVASSPIVVLCLPTSSIVAEVVAEVKPQLIGKTVIDATTGDPEKTAALGESLAEVRIDYLDATIAGSSAQVRQGEAIVMAGGRCEVFERSQPLLALFAKQAFHVGPWGSGARMKLVVNLAIGLHRAVLAESLALARQSGLDVRAALEILKSGPAYSRAMDAKGVKMIEGDFAPQAKLSQHLKDVRLILSQGERCEVALPLSRLHEQILSQLEAAGFGDLDNSAVYRAYDSASRVD